MSSRRERSGFEHITTTTTTRRRRLKRQRTTQSAFIRDFFEISTSSTRVENTENFPLNNTENRNLDTQANNSDVHMNQQENINSIDLRVDTNSRVNRENLPSTSIENNNSINSLNRNEQQNNLYPSIETQNVMGTTSENVEAEDSYGDGNISSIDRDETRSDADDYNLSHPFTSGPSFDSMEESINEDNNISSSQSSDSMEGSLNEVDQEPTPGIGPTNKSYVDYVFERQIKASHAAIHVKKKFSREEMPKFRELPFRLHGLQDFRSKVTAMEFDKEGILLAVGNDAGVIRLFDFDELFHDEMILRNRLYCKFEPIQINPVRCISIDLRGAQIKCIRWNPENQDELACSFRFRKEIYVFNLRNMSVRPKAILLCRAPPSTGCFDISYLPGYERNNKRSTAIIGVDSAGGIKLWDIKTPDNPLWSIQQSNLGMMTCLCHREKSKFLYTGTSTGLIQVWNIKQMEVKPFTSRSQPKKMTQFHVPTILSTTMNDSATTNCGIVSMQFIPNQHNQIVCELMNQWLVIFDSLSGTLRKFRHHQGGIRNNYDPGRLFCNGNMFCRKVDNCLILSDLNTSASNRKSTRPFEPSTKHLFYFPNEIESVSKDRMMINTKQSLSNFLQISRWDSEKFQIVINHNRYAVYKLMNKGKTIVLEEELAIESDDVSHLNNMDIYIQMQFTCSQKDMEKFKSISSIRITLEEEFTVMECHPTMDIVVCGYTDNSVGVIGPCNWYGGHNEIDM